MPDKKLLVKKYSNRRLYSVEDSTYLTLEDIGQRIRDGYQVAIVDSKTQEDITVQVLMQLILEAQQKYPQRRLLTSEFLHQLIQVRDQSIADFFQRWVPEAFSAYLTWQKEAQVSWARWTDFFIPPFWRAPLSHPAPDQSEELLALKQRLAELEKKLQTD
jgi:polyhydroxyalkanoate synthesis repressor PhaR